MRETKSSKNSDYGFSKLTSFDFSRNMQLISKVDIFFFFFLYHRIRFRQDKKFCSFQKFFSSYQTPIPFFLPEFVNFFFLLEFSEIVQDLRRRLRSRAI